MMQFERLLVPCFFLLCTAEAIPAAAQGLFEGPHWPMPLATKDLKSGDLNRDGRPDLIVALLNHASAGYLPSQGFGQMGALVPLPAPGAGTTPSAGDFTSDGFDDLVQVVLGAVRVFPGLSGGQLGAPITTALTGQPNSRTQEVVDLDLDGRADVVLDDPTNGNLTFLLGDGAGGFAPQTDLPLGPGRFPFEVRSGLLNADVWPDLAATFHGSQGNGIVVFLTNGPASFAAPVHYLGIAVFPQGLDVGDFTGDGTADVAFADLSRITVLSNDGSGVLSNLGPAGASDSETVTIADMDEDGIGDLVFTFPGGVRIARAVGGGSFAPGGEHFVGVKGPLLVDDFDGDGHLDIARSNNGASVSYGDGAGGLRGVAPTLGPGRESVQGDLDHDGDVDLVLADLTSVKVLRHLPGGGFAPAVSYPLSLYVRDVAIGFIDGDAHLDVAVTTELSKVFALLGDGAGALGAPIETSLGAATHNLALGEFTGDGITDLIEFPATGSPPRTVHLRPGHGDGTFGAPSATLVGAYPRDPRIADVDQDGDLDLALAQGDLGQSVLLLNDGFGSFTVVALPLARANFNLCLADVDADGILDLLAAGSDLEVHLGLGGGAFAAPAVSALASTWIEVGDVTGDGLVDIVALGSYTFSVLRGLGDGAFETPSSYHTPGQDALHLIHVDGDPRLDVVVIGWRSAIHLGRDAQFGPQAYCEAKPNSLGCIPAIGWSGVSSANAPSGFLVHAQQVRNRKAGLLMHGVSGRAAIPFSGGTLCVRAPVRRTPGLASGGSPSGNDCTGVYQIDMNAFAAGALGGNPSPALSTPGTAVTCQFWGRDPGFPAPSNTTLSDALEYVVGN